MNRQSRAKQIADAADAEGLTVFDFVRFEDLCEKHGISQWTDPLLNLADRVHRSQSNETCSIVDIHNKMVLSKLELSFSDNDITNRMINPIQKGQTEMTPLTIKAIPAAKAKAVLTGLGLKNASKFSAARISTKLNTLPKLATDEVMASLEPKVLKATRSLLTYLEDGYTLEVTKPEVGEAPVKKTAAKKAPVKKATAKKAPVKKATAASDTAKPSKKAPVVKKAANVDAWGSRDSTIAHRVNVAIGDCKAKTFTVSEMWTSAGEDIKKQQVRNIFASLVKRGFIDRVPNGYAIAKGQKRCK